MPTSTKENLPGTNDLSGKPMRDSDQKIIECHASSIFKIVKEAEMIASEVSAHRKTEDILALIGMGPKVVKNILISEIMPVDDCTFYECLGPWEFANNRLVIKRDQLSSLEAYVGTMLHESNHAISGASDTTREFEQVLTSLLGRAASNPIKRNYSVDRMARDDR